MIFDTVMQRVRVTAGQKISRPISWLTGSNETASGVKVSPEKALSSTAVLSAVRRISNGIAMLPLPVYKRSLSGRPRKERAPEHTLYKVLHDTPNPEQTSFEFRRMMQGSLLIRGNAYAEIVMNNYGQLTELWPLRSDRTWVERKNGQLWYHTIAGGKEYVLPKSKVLHLSGFGIHGLVGLCLTETCKEAIGTTLAQEEYQGRFFRNNAVPRGVLEHPGKPSKPARKNIRDSWEEEYGGLDKQHRVAILWEDMKFKHTGISNEDAQLIEGRTFQIQEVARIWDIPPHLLAELSHATFTNIEHQSLEFVIYTLGPWIKNWEQRISLDLLSEGDRKEIFAEFVVEGLLRGDAKARAEFYQKMWFMGVLTQNEIRDLENWNPFQGGDGHWVQLSMVRIDDTGTADEGVDGEQDTRDLRFSISDPLSLKLQRTSFGFKGGRARRELVARDPETRRKVAARKAAGRRRLRGAYKPLIREAAGRLVRAEIRDIRQAIKKHFTRDAITFTEWIEGYYGEEFMKLVRKIMGPVLAQYGADVSAMAAEEIDSDVPDLEEFFDKYLTSLGVRLSISSQRQIEKLLKEAEEIEEGINQRLEEWEETKPGKISDRETVQYGDAVTAVVWTFMGVSYFWQAGAGACPLCEELNGQKVGMDGVFVPAGGRIDPDDENTAPLEIKTNISHPPLHQGCECTIVAG